MSMRFCNQHVQTKDSDMLSLQIGAALNCILLIEAGYWTLSHVGLMS